MPFAYKEMQWDNCLSLDFNILQIYFIDKFLSSWFFVRKYYQYRMHATPPTNRIVSKISNLVSFANLWLWNFIKYWKYSWGLIFLSRACLKLAFPDGNNVGNTIEIYQGVLNSSVATNEIGIWTIVSMFSLFSKKDNR